MRVLADNFSALSINTATFGHRRPIEEIIYLCASRGIGAIAPWRRDLEGKNISDIQKRLKKSGLKLSGLCRSTFFPQSTAEARKNAIADNIKALSIAAELEAPCFVLVVGGLPGQSKDLEDARQQVKDGVNELLVHAKRLGVPLAFEPLHPMTAADRSCLTTLSQALDWCDELDPNFSGYLGVAIDVYHVWWDPQLKTQIHRACTNKRALAFHVCDWLNPTSDLVLDRGMMGDGVIELNKIRGWMEDSGYEGPVEVEIFSANNWWKRTEEETLDVCIERLTTIC